MNHSRAWPIVCSSTRIDMLLWRTIRCTVRRRNGGSINQGSPRMKRDIFESEHDDFRATARAFYEKECAPYTDEWEKAGMTDRSVWLKAGATGLLGWEAPEEFGGQGISDFRFNAIMNEEYY